MKKQWILGITAISLLAAMVFAISPAEKYQLDNFKVSTLKGLTGVAVKVRIIRDKEITLEYLKESALQRDVEMALQKGGVEILRPTADVGLYIVIVKVAGGNPEATDLAMDVQSSVRQIVDSSRLWSRIKLQHH